MKRLLYIRFITLGTLLLGLGFTECAVVVLLRFTTLVNDERPLEATL